MGLVAIGLVVLDGGLWVVSSPAATKVRDGDASELPALRSDPAPGRDAVRRDGVFSSPPPVDGDVARANEELAEARRESPPDPSNAKVLSRDAGSEVVENADGTRTTKVSTDTTNFQDEAGVWHPVDSTLMQAPDGSVTPRSTPVDMRLAARADARDLVRVGDVGWSVRFGFEGATAKSATIASLPIMDPDVARKQVVASPDGKSSPEAKTSPGAQLNLDGVQTRDAEVTTEPLPEMQVVEYRDVQPGIDLRYLIGSSSVKEQILLRQPPSAPLVLRFPLQLDGVTAKARDDGGISFIDASGTEVAVMPPGVVHDADAWKHPGDPTQYQSFPLRVEDGVDGPVVVIEPDATWLADPARVYPIAIDPQLIAGLNNLSVDAQGLDCAPTVNQNGSAQLVGLSNGWTMYVDLAGWGYYGCTWASYSQFDISSLNGKQITDAYLTLPTADTFDQGDGLFTYIRPITAAWNENTVNWYHHQWVRPEALYVPMPWWSRVTVTDPWIKYWVQHWVSDPTLPVGDAPYPNFGFNYLNWGGRTFTETFAAENGNLWYNPWLTIDWNSLPGVPSLVGPGDGTVFSTTTPTGFSSSTVTDPEGQTVKYWLRVSTNPGGDTGQVYNSGWVATPDSSPTGFFGPGGTIPAGTLQDGVTYYWKVYAGDFATPSSTTAISMTSASTSRSFKINLRLGAQPTNPVDTFGPATVNLSNGNLSVTAGSPAFPTVGGPIGLTFAYNSQQPITQGLRGSYYDEGPTPNFTIDPGQEPFVVRDDPRIDLNWGATAPAPNGPTDNVLIRWKGYVTVPVGGDWVFGARSDDGVRIWVNQTSPTTSPFNGQLNQWVDQSLPASPQWGSTVTGLTAGQPVPIQIDYYERGQVSAITLFAKKADGSVTEQIVDASWLSTDPPVLPQGWRASADLDGSAGYTGANVSTNQAVVYDASGQPHTYSWTGSGFTPPAGEYSTLVRNTDGTLTLQDESGTDYQFSAAGQLLSLTVAGVDDRAPAAPKYNYTGTPPRLASIEDRVSGKKLLLKYSGDAACPSPPSGGGFESSAPLGMLCKLDYTDWGSGVTNLFYVSKQLARIENPGSEVTDFAYGSGLLTKIRDPLAADAVAAPASARPDNDTTRTIIHYDGANRVDSIKLAEPTVGGDRPEHQYRYISTTETQVDVVALAQPNGYARKVTFDAAGRTLTDVDAAGLPTNIEWDPAGRDLPIKTTSPSNLITTATYDSQGRPTASSGPAPPGVTGPTSTTTYDGGLQGLAATYWNNKTLTGVPVAHTFGVGNTALGKQWPSGTSPVPGVVNENNFSMRLTGEINFTSTQPYSLRAYEDNGFRMWIDDKLVLDDGFNEATWGWLNWVTYTPPTAGWHRIRIDFMENTGDAYFQVNWIPPGGGETVIPNSVLTPRYDLVTSSTDAENQTTTTTYADPATGLPTATTQDPVTPQNPSALAITTETVYEPPSPTTYYRRTSRTLPAGNAWTYDYYGPTAGPVTNTCSGVGSNQGGALKSRTGPDPDGAGGPQLARVEEFVYDQAGRISGTHLAGEAWTCLEYDARGRITKKTIPAISGYDGPIRIVNYVYQVGDNPLVAAIDDGATATAITTTRDLLGRVVTYTDAWNQTTTTSYDQPGRVTSNTGPLGTQSLTYDPNGRVDAVKLGTDVLAVPAYDAYGRLDSVTYPVGVGNAGNGTSLAPVIRDELQRVTTLEWRDSAAQPMTTDTITRTPGGRIIDQSIDGIDAALDLDNFGYDSVGRLTNATVPGHTLAYFYAPTSNCPTLAAGKNTNRTSMTDNGGTAVEYCYDNADKLTSTTATGYANPTYDTHGNTTRLGNEFMGYDSADRHTWSSLANGRDILFVVGNPTSPPAADVAIRDHLVADGWTVTYRDDNGVTAAHANGKAFVLISSTVASSSVGTTFRDIALPVVTWEEGIYDEMGFVAADAHAVTGGSWNDALVGDPDNELAGGLTGTIAVSSSLQTQTYADPIAGTPTVAVTRTSNTNRKLQFGFDTGTAMAGTLTAPARRVGTFLNNTAATALTTDGWKLFDAAINWATTRVEYTRDATDRIIERTVNDKVVAKYAYTGPGDTPDLVLDATDTVIEKNYGLPGGASLTKRAATDVWSYPNLHGDTTVTADAAGTKTGGTFTYDPYGQALVGLPDNSNGTFDNAWLGKHQRGLEHQAGLLPIIEMGARQYSATLGRFLGVDPIEGGSCNDYDYVCAEPVNGLDLSGTRSRARARKHRPPPRQSPEPIWIWSTVKVKRGSRRDSGWETQAVLPLGKIFDVGVATRTQSWIAVQKGRMWDPDGTYYATRTVKVTKSYFNATIGTHESGGYVGPGPTVSGSPSITYSYEQIGPLRDREFRACFECSGPWISSVPDPL